MSENQRGRFEGRTVEVIDAESHRGVDVVQIRTVDDGPALCDPSGNPPWVPADSVTLIEEIEDGLVRTPENAVALADGRTPAEAKQVREEMVGNE